MSSAKVPEHLKAEVKGTYLRTSSMWATACLRSSAVMRYVKGYSPSSSCAWRLKVVLYVLVSRK